MKGFLLKIARFCFSRASLAFLCLLFAASVSWFWACEVWQRPDVMVHWDERWMIAAAAAGFVTGGVLLANPGRASGIRRTWIMATFSGLVFAGICGVAHITAVQGLMRHRAVVSPNPVVMDTDGMSGIYVPNHPTGINEVLSRFHYQDVPLDHLLEASRWRVRMAFLKTIITDEKHASMATRDWHRLFPAVIGQDVTLTRRHEMIRVLDKLARDESVSAASRNAAVFWMGLVVLTDTESFATGRARVRDMMLASNHPPMSLTGDVWMRVLNSLLAFDGPEKVTETSKVLASDRMLLRRAVREGVRGMENQVEAVMREIEALDAAGERTAAAALWLDLRLLIERADEPDAHGIIRNWLRDKLVMWLMEDSFSVRMRFMDERNRAMAEDFMLEMTEQVRAKLAGHAMRVLESAPSQSENIGRSERHPRYVPPVEVEHALMIRNFLDAGNRKMVSGRIAAIMTEHIRFVKNQKRTINRLLPEMNEMVVALLNLWEDIDDGMR